MFCATVSVPMANVIPRQMAIQAADPSPENAKDKLEILDRSSMSSRA